ncbi:iron-sulfur cluster carrier protein [Haloarcula mannanilytica]|uniref:Iron-sulfur cluster carrier protein n=1 Tax=Haloarcula mannanilytica TaxID=2509225 RepID=A0A4C2EQ02_9EURY|nr:P-loop NTPase [Haloarcula mannanilytica]GCF15530.1 iron-sulfur cluster carrier protein [Haloarcula mannanilytica]
MTDGTPTTLTDRIETALRDVRDPNADLSVFDAGFVENIDAADGEVTIEADLTALDGQTSTQVVQAMLHAVDDVDGVESVHVERTTPTSEDHASVASFDHVIAVASAKGGVGKSTVATHLACALAADSDVALFDADIHGPNVPELLDVSGPVHSSEEGDPLPVRTGDMDVMSVGLMESGAPLAWRGAMAHDALDDLFENTAWRNDDVLVLDLPPGTGDVVLTTLQEVPVDGVVVVTTPFHASVSDTSRTVELFRDNDVPVLGTVVNMAEYVCDCCGEPNDLFTGDALADLDADVLAELPFSHDLQGTPAPGDVPASVADLGDAVESALDTAGEVTVDPTVDIRDLPPQERKDRVRERFTTLDSGESFVLVSDRDPTPVGQFLGRLAEAPREAFDPFEVRRETPEAWVLETVKP